MSLALTSNLARWKARQRAEFLLILSLWLEGRKTPWRGTASDLADELIELLGESPAVPSPHTMASTLRDLAAELGGWGWAVTRQRTGQARYLTFERIGPR